MSQPQSLTTESPAAAAVQQPPPVHLRNPIVATRRPTSPASAASLNSSQSATTTLASMDRLSILYGDSRDKRRCRRCYYASVWCRSMLSLLVLRMWGHPLYPLFMLEMPGEEGEWLLPGFVSAHSHLWQSKFAGQAPNSTVAEWGDGIYSEARELSVSEFYDLTMQGARNHIRKGITTAFNFTFSARFREGQTDWAQFEGALDSGVRFFHGFNIGAIREKWTPELALQRARLFVDWASTFSHSSQYLGTMIAHHGINYDTDINTRMEAEVMRKLDLGGQIHYLESPRPVDVDLEQSRWKWLRDAGAVNLKLTLGHFLHPTPEILDEASSSGLKMSWNPMSNGRLGSGIADIPKYRRHNLPIGMGVDGEASSDRSDPFENMRVGLYSVRGKYQDPSVLTPQDVFQMHTLDAADVLGVDGKVGSLEVGKLADIVLLNPPHMGHLGDPVSAFVFSSGVEDIERVFIGGKEVWPRTPPPAKPTCNWPAWEF